ncbi:phosphate ABC transporter ATP-binding protein [Trichocoleus sp. FACHB-90]|uniref:phosphate ABC transporter ATP-binding protein n=1 Tax=Cyanophyceae TaxID=3028117 RepID=UPI0016855D71|nr:phosphate ABC transporter ATP-binding protein [Trichocoleus sp. FACHB-90]MBD1925276.1 phosphate ABC transporter ATP-binding protein [Trichocoleus sp. FACHB-90]
MKNTSKNEQHSTLLLTQPPEIQTENLSLSYANKPAFKDVTFSIKSGSITALIGPSGCGKTSFLTCLNRLTDLTASCRLSGRILLGNQDVQEIDVISLRRRVGMLFQKPNPFPLSIIRNIEFPLREHGVKSREKIDEVVEDALRDVGLWDEVKDRLKSPALALSGGQQQRLCLARAIALKPDVLLMDEPCSALDPLSSEVVEDLIANLRGKYTVLVVTHNLAQAKRIADDVALFWFQNGAGQLIESGSVTQIFASPQHPLTAAYVTGRRG